MRLLFKKEDFMKPGVINIRTSPKSCQGCRTCEAVCSVSHYDAVNPNASGIHIKEGSVLGNFKIIVCLQCYEMYCAKACPNNNITRNSFSGAVEIGDKCVGCGACAQACEINAINLVDMGEGKKAIKCDLCGGLPACTSVCPRNCLAW